MGQVGSRYEETKCSSSNRHGVGGASMEQVGRDEVFWQQQAWSGWGQYGAGRKRWGVLAARGMVWMGPVWSRFW